MKVAAVQMCCRLADVDYNLERAAVQVRAARAEGAELVVLPEFFSTGMGFARAMCATLEPLHGGRTLALLRQLARECDVPVGGSFLALRDGHSYNTFALAMPDGEIFAHDKDQPTMWENCYFRGGSDDGVLETPLGRIGAVMCWEFLRTRTMRRLIDRVDLVIGGSCWWTIPERGVPLLATDRVHERMFAIAQSAPVRVARMLGVPVVHAGQAGTFRCEAPWLPGFVYSSHCVGGTKVVDAAGNVVAQRTREDGESIAIAEVEPGGKRRSEPIPDRFWIPDLPAAVRFAWWYQNLHGARYYERQSLPYWRERGLL
jgi:N-carbamoylputrescine amidase